MTKELRKRKFINSWAQVSIAIEVVLHALLLLSLIALFLFAPPFVNWLSKYSLSDHQAVAQELWTLNISKWPIFLGIALFIGFVSVLFSHHIVGPGYRFQTALQELSERNLGVSVHLRKWDYLIEVQDELNRHTEILKNDLGLIHKSQERAAAICEELKEGQKAALWTELEKELGSIRDVIKTYKGL